MMRRKNLKVVSKRQIRRFAKTHFTGNIEDMSFANDEGIENVDTLQIDQNRNENEMQERLADWAIDHNITLNAITNLLKILKLHDCFNKLPSDGRTLLKSPRTVITKEVTPGSYVHFGVEKEIRKFLTDNINSESINIAINIDGLPLAKSSRSVLWPILGSIFNTEDVFIIGAYHGYEKPSCANSYLQQFVEEAKSLSETGIHIGDKTLKFNVKAVICDAPAKSFVLNVKGHGGYSSCTKCTAKGRYVGNRVCYPETNSTERKDEDIILKADTEFYNEEVNSLLEEIPNLGLVSNVPLDYMHLVCLGVMRKMLNLWTKGSITDDVRLPCREVSTISGGLEEYKKYTPSGFAGRPRSLNELSNWKATEFRQLLLYAGPLALQGVLDSSEYVNFLSFHVAVGVLVGDGATDEINLAYVKDLLVHFVNMFGEIYGIQNISYNVHGLIHLPNDVKTYGRLDNFSLFKFENFLQKLKRLLRKSERPLQQLWRGYHEVSNIKNFKIQKVVENQENESDVIEKIHVNGFLLRANSKADSCCGLQSGEIVLISRIFQSPRGDHIMIGGNLFLNRGDLCSLPRKSSSLGIYAVSQLSSNYSWDVSKIVKKYAIYPMEEEFAVLPLMTID